MKILWFTENYPPSTGGMARSCDRIITNLRAHHTVDIYHFSNKIIPFQEEANVGGTYTAVPLHYDSAHTLNVLWAFLKATNKAQNADALVAFGSHLCIKGLPLISQWLNKPLLTCFRGNDFDASIFSAKKQDVLYAIENSGAIACVTQEKVGRIKSMKLNKQVYFTPNSIVLDDWTVLKSDHALAKTYRATIDKDVTVIGLLGYLKQKKGIDFFVKTLLKSPLINKVYLRIVGEIDPTLEAQLKALNIPYTVVVPNSKSELIANYVLCDAVAIPSIYDGMPNVALEAGALNIPVIASNAGGLEDLLDDDNAYLFGVLSQDGLIQALSNFHRDTSTAIKQKSKRLRTKIEKEFHPDIEIKNYLNILNTLS